MPILTARCAAPEAASESVSEFVEQTSFHGASEFNGERLVEAVEEHAGPAVENVETKSSDPSYELPALDFSTPETETTSESAYAASMPEELNATQEVPPYQEPDYVSHAEPPAVEEPAHVTETVEELIREGEPMAATAVVQQPDMDALVARVVAKMSPDVLQRVTQEILKPVIEALIKDELAAKK